MIKVNIISNYKTSKKLIQDTHKYLEKKFVNFNKKFKEHKRKIIYLTLLFTGNEEIKRLNKKFRKKNKSTDVLSFPFYVKKDLKKKIKTEKEIYLGDIIININKIKNKRNKKIFRLELDKLWIHGLAHLLGYDHRKNKDFEKMIKIEKKFLSYL